MARVAIRINSKALFDPEKVVLYASKSGTLDGVKWHFTCGKVVLCKGEKRTNEKNIMTVAEHAVHF